MATKNDQGPPLRMIPGQLASVHALERHDAPQ